jgi:branched-chain amino acid transport system substrate-binding protein
MLLEGFRQNIRLSAFVLLWAAIAMASACKPSTPSGTGTSGGSESSAGTASGSATAEGTAGEQILVGHYASMTGSEATFGVSTDQGIRLAIKERNAAGGVKGRPIKLITYDNQGKAQESVTAVTRLIQQDKVAAVLGEVASSRSLAGGPVCQRLGVPMVSPSSTNPDVTAIGDMIFRVCYIDPFQGWVCAKFTIDTLKKTRAATLYNRAQAYHTGLNRNFIDAFTSMGGQIVSEQAYSDGDNDFSAQITAIREANPDVVFVPGYYTEIVNIARQARGLGLSVPLMGGDGWDSEELRNAGDSLNGCYFSNHYSHEDQSPVVQEFIKKYQAEYGKIPDGLAALGYDAARILFDSMDRAASLGGKDLAAAIAATANFPGVTGSITLDAQRNAKKDAVVLEIIDGETKYVTTIKAE